MPAPKRPTPNHPLAQSAAEIENLAPAPTAKLEAPPVTPAAPPATVVTPQPTPTPTPDPTERAQAMMDTMMGRLEKLNEDNRRLSADVGTLDANRQFLEQSLNERNATVERITKRNAELESIVETDVATRGFTSDLVDKDHFAEIFRGMQPFFKRTNDLVSSVVSKNVELERKLAEAIEAPKTVVDRLRKELLDKNVRKGAPDFSKLLKTSKEFQDFLQERIPGSRRTRMQEVQEAWDQEDEQYFVDVVADFGKRGNPQAVPSADPPRTITEQQPTAPQKEPLVTDDHVQAGFEKTLSGEMTRAEFKQLLAMQNKQVTAGRVK